MPHDLTSPHIILNDAAYISCITDHVNHPGPAVGPALIRKPVNSMEDFISSVEMALEETRLTSGAGHRNLLENIHYGPHNIREATNIVQTAPHSRNLLDDCRSQPRGNVNRFEIMRDGVFVATVVLGRPAFRLGESISVVIDFQNSAVKCLSLTAILESSEIIDPAVALRSQASIYRATRRVYASQFEFSLFERRAEFSPMAPSNATSSFRTSSLSLAWMLRFEFLISQNQVEGTSALLRELIKNERGTTLSAVQMLSCEKFEVTVPLNIYGGISSQFTKDKIGEYKI